MTKDKCKWNNEVVVASFIPEVSNTILSIPINLRQQDTFVWAHFASGKFSIRSSYKTNYNNIVGQLLVEGRKKWQLLQHSNLHERHKLMFWRILVNSIPTKDRIMQFVPLSDESYFLCRGDTETLHHIFFYCPSFAICWWNSPWNVCIQNFAHLRITDWIVEVLDKSSVLQVPLKESKQNKILHFATLVIRICLGNFRLIDKPFSNS